MMNRQTVWVDVACCMGCGACADVCPTGAIVLVDGEARVYEERCTGCGACIDACPEGAIQPMIQGELVPAPERPAPTVYQPGSLARTAGAAVAAASAGLLMKAAGALVRATGRWPMRRPAAAGPFLRQVQDTAAGAPSQAAGGMGRGRRARHRRRGR
jgi:NAD-dependent dihydropyrimidine dehydrogenase PreA subunit